MQKTGEIIYKIMDIYSTSGKIQSELEQFSIEILLRRIPKSIFGLFTIDSSHVATIVRSTITYVIILVQFNYNLHTQYDEDIFPDKYHL
ncbi:putative gustatory receptor 28b [Cotesia glomerata]|uniref:putative gustatory receptor 28b n=1 Tax=Cotesia glomerata TaxID=32391 RepID=UPI001D005287|nr:putative gustatory receptor 28b [Cotesia glomerata]